ncbi:FAD-dependent monooxygenase [Amycolatopsis sp. H20-H5]|uniref:FAD-dependent monooxygenase n=1 Tax=Amycolatopsis sp. H20-H5 TaxID=3046309 RepID=UPI002DB6CD92|nr:FAD-dependent monooxygenase [Amycolatopsis sp. H20-H5]MEC3975510.1 FAD-dependent monooxygenase [Amycolatopsis sp. H20-H5]
MVVAGGGPAGLMLAGELRLTGVDVIVLERLPQRTGESRGLGFTARSMEVFDQRGLLSRFGEIETSAQGHFGGVPVDFGLLDGAHQAAKTIPQSVTESVLEGWVGELGADIRRGHELVDVRDLGDGVEITVRGPSSTYVLRADWLVGCDGGRSTVRKLAGFDFPGTAASREMFLADLRGVDLEPRMIGETLPGGMVMVGPLPGGITRIIVCERDAPPRRRTEAPPFHEVADAWKRITGIDISHAEPVWTSAFGDATRQVTEYRRGRILLVGDAAHIHLPAGGQGMNVSIQDSVNLGWKLAAVVRGSAPVGLLDSYHDERHRVGARLLMNTRAQGLLFLNGEDMQPLRELVAELSGFPDVARHLAGMVSGLEIRYDVGGGSHPLLGRRLPRMDLDRNGRGVSTAELLHPGRGVLLDLAGNPVLHDRAAAWIDRIDVVTARLAKGPLPTTITTTAVLLRPDGYVAWAAPGTHGDLPMALERWFGPAKL